MHQAWCKICMGCRPGAGKKTELWGANINPKQTSCERYHSGCACFLCSQRLPRGLPCVMNNAG